jgi:hypothetical protein
VYTIKRDSGYQDVLYIFTKKIQMIYSTRFLKEVLGCRRKWSWKLRHMVNSIHRMKVNVVKPQPKRRKPKNFHRGREYALREMDHLPDDIFQRMFRLDRSTFDEILEIISALLLFAASTLAP